MGARSNGRHGRNGADGRGGRVLAVVITAVVALALAFGVAFAAGAGHRERRRAQATPSASASADATDTPSAAPTPTETRSSSPTPTATHHTSEEAKARAKQIVASMDLNERAAQLVMAPLAAGTDPSAVRALIADDRIGSVILMGNWTSGVDGVRAAADTLQGYAGSGSSLLIATDQEGGQVQHLQGPGFDTMPSARMQGQLTTASLEDDSRQWGAQLHAAGVNVDLAPSVDTVTIDRASNAPIGALDRDFGLDAAGNAAHAVAFIDGMRASSVATAVKHYPGLGSVTGNTDFTDAGIVDATTSADGPEVAAFTEAIRNGRPAMVMMSLASYTQLDPGVPAAFSSRIVTGLLREHTGYDGVIISDSLSASAVGGIEPAQLGVRLVEAGGDIACINDPSYTTPILQGLRERATADAAFADKVTASAERVVALKIGMGLIE